MMPKDLLKGDWEGELGVFMRRVARNVSEATALHYVAG
jgi:2-keto-4-pentenoate hydratase/2-oxohepta-3-ene-1,7-dioic acid hydratase in catechol pathway